MSSRTRLTLRRCGYVVKKDHEGRRQHDDDLHDVLNLGSRAVISPLDST